MMGTYFPQILLQNLEKLFKDTMIAYEDDPDEYDSMPQPMMPTEGEGQPGEQPGAEQATAGGGGLPPLPPI